MQGTESFVAYELCKSGRYVLSIAVTLSISSCPAYTVNKASVDSKEDSQVKKANLARKPEYPPAVD